MVASTKEERKMSIRDKEEQLFSEWKKNRKGFVSDGVVSEEDYENSNPKIAVILKEVNDEGGGNWDLREFLRKGARAQTWDNVARWVHGIREMRSRNAMPDWQYFPTESQEREEFRKETLRSICAMNVKKSPGGHTSDGEAVRNVAHEDRENIKEQYGFYKPDITIFGGASVEYSFTKAMGYEVDWVRTKRGIWWYKREKGEREKENYVISFAHPAARVSDSLLVYGLLDAVQEIYRPA